LQKKRKGVNRKPNLKYQYKVNRLIRHNTVRLVGDNVEAGVYDIRDAQRKANELGLDLVEISSKADPPVCTIVDFNKFLYEKKKKEKELKARQVKTVVKEIRFTPNTDSHDFEFKAKHAEKFLQEGSKVKTYVQFKGRNIVFKDRGQIILLRFAERLEDYGVPEQMPQLEGRRMFLFLTPKKTNKVKKAGTAKPKVSIKDLAPLPEGLAEGPEEDDDDEELELDDTEREGLDDTSAEDLDDLDGDDEEMIEEDEDKE
jgi:translation initiation factor IF-3